MGAQMHWMMLAAIMSNGEIRRGGLMSSAQVLRDNNSLFKKEIVVDAAGKVGNNS